jgi:hypothetical protein
MLKKDTQYRHEGKGGMLKKDTQYRHEGKGGMLKKDNQYPLSLATYSGFISVDTKNPRVTSSSQRKIPCKSTSCHYVMLQLVYGVLALLDNSQHII